MTDFDTTQPPEAEEAWCDGCFMPEHEGACRELTIEEAAAIQTASGNGMMTCGLREYHPGINCWDCGRFVGRDGHIEIEHAEMSSSILSIGGQCRRCADRSCSIHGHVDCERCAA